MNVTEQKLVITRGDPKVRKLMLGPQKSNFFVTFVEVKIFNYTWHDSLLAMKIIFTSRKIHTTPFCNRQ